MKSYRTAIAVLVLTLVFSTSATANTGVIWMEKAPPPPPPTNGVIWTDSAVPALEENTLTEIALSLLQTLIPLL